MAWLHVRCCRRHTRKHSCQIPEIAPAGDCTSRWFERFIGRLIPFSIPAPVPEFVDTPHARHETSRYRIENLSAGMYSAA